MFSVNCVFEVSKTIGITSAFVVKLWPSHTSRRVFRYNRPLRLIWSVKSTSLCVYHLWSNRSEWGEKPVNHDNIDSCFTDVAYLSAWEFIFRVIAIVHHTEILRCKLTKGVYTGYVLCQGTVSLTEMLLESPETPGSLIPLQWISLCVWCQI